MYFYVKFITKNIDRIDRLTVEKFFTSIVFIYSIFIKSLV